MPIPDPFGDTPVLLVIAGSNGAGKTTFYHAHLRDSGLRFVNADDIARNLGVSAYEAASLADSLRRELVRQRESFVFETVFSDPVGDKLAFIEAAAASGYRVVLCFIGIPDPETSEQRVALRLSQGGHDVPAGKLISRFPRTLANLKKAIRALPIVWVYDNSDLTVPFRKIAEFQDREPTFLVRPIPDWLREVL